MLGHDRHHHGTSGHRHRQLADAREAHTSTGQKCLCVHPLPSWCRTEATLTLRVCGRGREQESIPPADPPSLLAPTLYPILRSSHSWEQPLSFLLRHSLMKQLSSSEPSVQSLLLSQSSASGMHFPFLQRKKESLHLFSAAGQTGGGTGQREAVGQPQSPAVVPTGTWAGAAWVLGRLVRVVVAVKLAVTFPLSVAEAPAVGTAELVGTTGGILCRRAAGSDGMAHLPEFISSDRGTTVPGLRGAVAQVSKRSCSPPWDRAAPQGSRRQQTWVVLDLSKTALCQVRHPVAGAGTALLWLSGTKPLPLSLLVPPHPALTSNPFLLDEENSSRFLSQSPGDPAWLPGPVQKEITALAVVPGPTDTHHTLGTRPSRRHSHHRGRRRSAWECTGGFRT